MSIANDQETRDRWQEANAEREANRERAARFAPIVTVTECAEYLRGYIRNSQSVDQYGNEVNQVLDRLERAAIATQVRARELESDTRLRDLVRSLEALRTGSVELDWKISDLLTKARAQ